MSFPFRQALVNQKLHYAFTAAASVLLCLAAVCAPQDPNIIPLKSEPHHHLKLHNDYVNVYAVEVSPHDSVVLHRHDADAVSVMLSDSEITVKIPGKPDIHQKVSGGQLRFQSLGYVHSTSIDGDTTYRNVTVELLQPQQHTRNLCAAVIPHQDLNCKNHNENSTGSQQIAEPQVQSDQTKVTLIRVQPHQSLTLNAAADSELTIAIDNITANHGPDSTARESLRSGEFLWRDPASTPQILKNDGDKESRVVTFVFNAPSN